MRILGLAFRAARKMLNAFRWFLSTEISKFLLHLYGVEFGRGLHSKGIPYLSLSRESGNFHIGNNFHMNNGIKGNPIGCYDRCTFCLDKNAELIIGDNVGISQSALVCQKRIVIGNNVKIGGGVAIYDTDFHSLDAEKRADRAKDLENRVSKEVIIADNVFIGAHTIILKGVTIGEDSIVGAGSVVTKNIPANEIWAGNPARFIRKTQ